MGILVDYVCTNCGFIGRLGDRGFQCCVKPKIVGARKYHDDRRAQTEPKFHVEDKLHNLITAPVKTTIAVLPRPEGCSDHNCELVKHTGVGTNGGCH